MSGRLDAVATRRNEPARGTGRIGSHVTGRVAGVVLLITAARARNLALTGALLSVLSSGVAFYLAFDVGAFGGWKLWAGALAAWGVFEAVRTPDSA